MRRSGRWVGSTTTTLRDATQLSEGSRPSADCHEHVSRVNLAGRRVIVRPSRAVASATTAAAVKAAVNPDGVRVLAPAPPAARPIAVNVAVPSAAPTWLVEPASPDASPA